MIGHHRNTVDEAALNRCDKGVPGNVTDLALREVASRNWNVLREDLPLPVAVLNAEALAHNGQWMRRFLAANRVQFAPHGKTSMSPALFERQIKDGAWAITLATPHQIQIARHFGYQRIFLANQLIGRSAIEFVLSELEADPHFEFYCLVDSVQGVQQLIDASERLGTSRPLSVLVEMGYPGGRTGCRTVTEGLKVARAAARGKLRLCGIEGFEGLLRKGSWPETERSVEAFLRTVTELARACEKESLFSSSPILLSAGGSAFFDLVVTAFSQADLHVPSMTLLRSGCYLTHDSLMYTVAFDQMKRRSPEVAGLGEGLRPVIEVWAYVQSQPEPGLAILGLGKRDISYDELPIPLKWFRPGNEQPALVPPEHRITRLNDQHAYLEIPANSPLAVGDMVCFGISHPCLTFDKWRVVHLVDNNYTVVESLRTYF
jgi:D-serine dehydratase